MPPDQGLNTDPGWFSLLGHLFLEEPRGALLDVLRHGEVVEILQAFEPGIAETLEETKSEAAVAERLAVAWCALFAVPGGPPPVASAWTTGHDGLAWAEQVDAWAAELGMRWRDEVHGRPPPDHVGVLCHLAAAAGSRAEAAGASSGSRALAADVVGRGLVPWASTWAVAARTFSGEPLYRAALALLVSLLEAAADPS